MIELWERLRSYKKRLPIADCWLPLYKFRMRQDELKLRTKTFALRVVKLIAALRKATETKEIAKQLVRCGTAVGDNCGATCPARSRVEFIAEMGVFGEESEESASWLELIFHGRLLACNLCSTKRTNSSQSLLHPVSRQRATNH